MKSRKNLSGCIITLIAMIGIFMPGSALSAGRDEKGLTATDQLSEAGYLHDFPLTPEAAECMLKSLPLSAEEGIWYAPADDMTLMVVKDLAASNTFGIYIVRANDCRLEPGMCIGTLTSTADHKLFKLRLMTSYHPKKGLRLPVDATAKANANFSRFTIEAPKLKFSLSPSLIIPNLLNMLRMRVNIRYSDPTEKVRDGWIKVYPYTDSDSATIYL
ncbi:MAG: hypothetical protein K2K29_02445 [Muribaculaceae bacterium]|nr:hypothetical protein [Muribaculaceae bacterium]